MNPEFPRRGSPATRVPGLVAIPILVLAVYWPALRGDFLWDDDAYVSENAAVQSPDGLSRIWSSLATGELPQYYPLTFMAFWLEWQSWGAETLGYHLVNVLCHSVNAVLLWLVLGQLGLPGAWLAAVVFALHPINVESVAWITELKNVLSGVFFLASFAAFWRYATAGGWGWYATSLLTLTGALLGKTSTVVLPAVLVIALWWDGRLVRRLWWGLGPMFALSLAAGAMTIWYEKERAGAGGIEWSAGFPERLAVAGRVVWFYLAKILFPYGFSFTYPRWDTDPKSPVSYLPVAMLVVAAVFLAARRRPWRRPLLAGLAAFVVCLFPVLGFFNVFFMRYSHVADHFAYLPAMCVVAVVVCGGAALLRKRDLPPLWPALGCVVLLGYLGVTSAAHARTFRDSHSLYRHILDRNPSSWMALNNLGTLLLRSNKNADAAECFRRARTINPIIQEPYDNERVALIRQGKYVEAVEVARLGKDHAKDNIRITLELARLLATAPDPAARDGQEAVIWARVVAEDTLKGRNYEALEVLACAYAENGQFGEAVAAAERAMELAHEAGRADWADACRERLKLFVNYQPYHEPGPETPAARASSAIPPESEAGPATLPPAPVESRAAPVAAGPEPEPPDSPELPPFDPPLPADIDQWEAPVRAALDTALERVQQAPADAQRVGMLGMLYHANRLYALAMPCYQRAMVLAPQEPHWPYLLACAASIAGDSGTAREALFVVQRIQPDYPATLYRLGGILLDAGQTEDAKLLFEHLTVVAPSSAGGYYGLGRIDYLQGRDAEARQQLLRALAIAPESDEVLHQLGMACLRLSRNDGDAALRERAREYLEAARTARDTALVSDPWQAELLRMPVGSALIASQAAEWEELGRLDRAADMLEEAVRRRPDHHQYLIQLARVRYKQRRLEESRIFCERATAVAPENYRNWMELAELCREMGDLSAAWEAVYRALELAPEEVRVMYLASRILLESGDLENAAAGFQRLLDRDPDHAEATVRLADVLLRTHRDADALPIARRAVELDPDDGYPRFVLGVALSRNGDFAGAERELREALKRSPDSAAAREQLDWVLRRVAGTESAPQ